MSKNQSNPIPLNTVLGERYKVTSSAAETADGDAVLEGKDQVLNRKVSIVVSSPSNNDRLITNARTMATNSRSTIQILDLGNTGGQTYLITSHSRPETLIDTLLADSSALAANSETQEALGQEIFGDEAAGGKGSYAASSSTGSSSISATRNIHHDAAAAGVAGAGTVAAADYNDEEFDDYEDGYNDYDEYPDEREFDDEDDRSRGGVWVVAIAAIIVLVIGVAAVFANLNGMVDKEASQQYAGSPAPETSSSASAESTSASPSPTETKKAEAKFTGTPTRLIQGSNTNFMSEMDSSLGNLTDGNDGTQWMSSGFGGTNFGGAIESFALAFELQDQTTVSNLKIQQASGTGGAFTVYTNNSDSLDGATEVGSGSFDSETVNVKLDTEKQGEGAKYVIIKFTEAPTLSQPIVSGYPYGTRINEVSVSN